MQVLPFGVFAHVHRLEMVGDVARPGRQGANLEAVVGASKARVGRAGKREAPESAKVAHPLSE